MNILYMNQGGGGQWGAIRYSEYDLILLAESTITKEGFGLTWRSGTQPEMSIQTKVNAGRGITGVEDLDRTDREVRPSVTFTTVKEGPIRVVFVHLKSGSVPIATNALKAAIRAVKDRYERELPTLWIGDFNRADGGAMNEVRAQAVFAGGGQAWWDLDRAYISGDWSDYVITQSTPAISDDHGHAAIGFAFTVRPERRKKRIAHEVGVLDKAAGDCADVFAASQKVRTGMQGTRKIISTVGAALRDAGAVPNIHDKAERLRRNLDAVDAHIAEFETATKTYFDFCAAYNDKAQALAAACHKAAQLLRDDSEQCHIQKKEPKRQSPHLVGLHSGDDADKIIIVLGGEDLLFEIQAANDLFAKMPDLTAIESSLQSIGIYLAGITAAINPLADPLKELEALLDRKFGVDLEFRIPPRIGKKVTLNVSISCSTILQGADAIEKEIERIIGKVAWKALKVVGVGKFVKYLIAEANSALDPILRKIGLGVIIPVGMPSLPVSLDEFQSIATLALTRIEVRLS
ncbi:MAG TPA: hypothetical protein VD969_27720 [Symbiobacteriaceae bacterium]|nr:hypothetical protein [Symbiobacteriaceae bacterium]